MIMDKKAQAMRKTERLKLNFVIVFLFLLILPSIVYAADRVDVCNRGDVELWYVSLGSRVTVTQNKARINGFQTIKPGECQNVLPKWMDRVSVAFFYIDEAGTFGNAVFKIDDWWNEGVDFQHVCVDPSNHFQGDEMAEIGWGGAKEFIAKWSPPCKQGFVPAAISMSVGEMRKSERHSIKVSPSRNDRLRPLVR